MRIESSYPNPIHGISTLAPRNRPYGYATTQVNFRSDPVNKLTRRPSSIHAGIFSEVPVTDIVHHSYERDGVLFSYILDTTAGVIYCYKDNVFIETAGPMDYLQSSNIEMYTIEHTTYILNKDVVVAKQDRTDTNRALFERVSHLNVTSALNYGETVTVHVTTSDDVVHTVSYTVPDLGTTPDYDTADKARATSQVALELAARINSGGTHEVKVPNPDYPEDPFNDGNYATSCNPYRSDGAGGAELNPNYDPSESVCQAYLTTYTGIPGVIAQAAGSSVAIWEDGRANWLQVEVETGQGERSVVAINQIVEDTTGLPLYAIEGTRITVRPDPSTDKGTYYLQAERTSNRSSSEPEEVVWVESRSPDESHEWDLWTLPHTITHGEFFETPGLPNEFYLWTTPFKERDRGDDVSAPFPEFLGNTIETIGYFQKRLVFVSGNSVYMSETDDLENWFRQSAVQLLVSDPVGIATSAVGTDKITHLVPHNRDLLCVCRNAQFKIAGNEAVTPQTVSMALTTKYECQVNTAPVSIGNSVYLPIDYGDSTGLQEYSSERNTNQDFAATVTNHVVGYLAGEIDLMVSAPNLEMIALTTSNLASNTILIYEQYTEANGKRSQQSWSEWVLEDGVDVVDMYFSRSVLFVILFKQGALSVREIPLYTRVTTSVSEIYLDDMLVLNTDGFGVTLPVGYDTSDIIAVRGEGTTNELWEAKFTISENTLTFTEDIGQGVVYVGNKFASDYEPTRPFRYDDDGSTITTDKLRVASYTVSLVDTFELGMTKKSTYSDDSTQVFSSKLVNAYSLGSIETFTGDWKFSFAEEASLATAVFHTDSYLGCTIADVSWEGQYFQSKRRM